MATLGRKINLLYALSFLLLTWQLKAKDYRNYYQLINAAEEKFILHKDNSCFADYDKAFRHYRPFLKDPFIASQIAFYLGDTSKCYTYLRLCFQNGMPLEALRLSPLFERRLNGAHRTAIQAIYQHSFKALPIDSALWKKICYACYLSDSLKLAAGKDISKLPAFFANENDSRRYLLDSFLTKGQFVNEMLLGISSTKSYRHFLQQSHRPDPYSQPGLPAVASDDLELRLKCPYNIVYHSRCFFAEHSALFRKAMFQGYMHPRDFAILEEDSHLKRKDSNPADTCPVLSPILLYNLHSPSPFLPAIMHTQTKEGLEEVERNRAAIALQKYSIDQQKVAFGKESGIVFFFDFLNRP